MATILKFDPANGNIEGFRESGNTPEFLGKPGFFINPVIPPNTLLKRLKIIGTYPNLSVVLRPQAELDAIDAADAVDIANEANRQNKIATANATIESLKGISNLSAAQIESGMRAFIVLKTSS